MNRVRNAIDTAECTFETCFETLALIKRREFNQANRKRLLAFQYELARAIFDLDEMYREIVQGQRALVTRKAAVTDAWFRSTMKRLATYADAIVMAMRIGKVLGDSLAWLFYQRDTYLLRKHLNHPGQLHTPPGIGGRGELQFIANPGIFPNHIVLYHGITSFLRLGDVTLVHLPTFTISGVAELKTRQVDDKTAEITVHLIGHKRLLPKRLRQMVSYPHTHAPRPRMSAQKEDQLGRQLRRMGELVDLSEPERRVSIENKSNIERLNELVRNAASRRLSYEKLDDGLAIVGIRLCRTAGLSARLLPTHAANVDKAVEPTRAIAMELADKSSKANSLIMQPFNLGYQPGMTPLFWSPVSSEVFRALLFQEVAAWSWFNPVHLVAKLRERGFEVETGDMGFPLRVIAPRRRGKAIADNLHTLMPLIQQHLFAEGVVVDTVERMFSTVEDANLDEHTRAVIQLNQFYGPLPPRRRRRNRSRDARGA